MSDKQIIPADQILPSRLHIIPLQGKPIFPGIFTPLMIQAVEEIHVVEEALSSDSMIGLVLVRDESEERQLMGDDLYRVGTVAKIVKKINLPDGGINIFISTLKRFRIKKFLNNETPLNGAVDYLDDEDDSGIEVKALTRSLISEMKQLSENNPLFSEEMRLNMVNIDHPGKIADFITSILNIDRQEQQKILETLNVRERMEQVLMFIKKEQELLRIQKKIQKQINEKIEKSQREYFLKEELKAIKQELGIPTDSKSSEYNRFKEAIDALDFEGEVKEQVEQELEKFSMMDPNSSEFIVTRNYLDTIVNLPWKHEVGEELDLGEAKKILDRDHYGLEDVKNRILEFLAVRKLKKDSKGSIICLVGAPGVGKTSVGKSIADALGKKFFRFSVGGMRDEAEIKGHRRTYVGAMPGKIIQGLKIVKTDNPVFMIDEIDKLGASYQGDPSSALLEVLDPEQNVNFRDHYLDLPFDISNIFFIATANSLDTIPRPLLDRMEVIHLSGYINEEKMAIARQYLIPKSLDRSGLKKSQIRYSKSTLSAIADQYAREAGMRNFEKALDRVHRKIAKKVVLEEHALPISVKPEDLEEYLGPPIFREDDVKKVTRAGMAIGLAWTNFGGDTLIIEAVNNPGKEGFRLTGQMGNVMQESANIAYTHVRHVAEKYGVDASFFEKNIIHLHIPEGATPKDGPSAGITMAITLLSLATGKQIKKNLAMTGELSLVGKVLPIGGLKEKTIAARRNKIKQIIIPKANERDLKEIPDHVKKGISFHPVETMEEVIELAL
ncbi:endopeptidase La [Sediminispirochaeta bajacaliforniensis]|uniref:endopeptidase La n=1 Tax=Sediminispirochaeta bajacaliforniensis TaxID=148 RepID=UPI00036A6497|nr:endopeptidase La [Sediminispirochaeta bajacaliforniensis]